MKRFICTFLALVLLPVLACADGFCDDFNAYAADVFGIAPAAVIFSSDTVSTYKTGSVEIMAEPEQVTIVGESAEEVIAAACCALRCIDNGAGMIDQYGRTLHAYFMAKAAGDEAEYRATTESGMMIFFSIAAGFVTARLVK